MRLSIVTVSVEEMIALNNAVHILLQAIKSIEESSSRYSEGTIYLSKAMEPREGRKSTLEVRTRFRDREGTEYKPPRVDCFQTPEGMGAEDLISLLASELRPHVYAMVGDKFTITHRTNLPGVLGTIDISPSW